MKTARIGLASFLFRARVPDVISPLCSYGSREETTKHITDFCSLYSTYKLQNPILSLGFSNLISSTQHSQSFLKWFMSLKRLDQFSLAYKLLY